MLYQHLSKLIVKWGRTGTTISKLKAGIKLFPHDPEIHTFCVQNISISFEKSMHSVVNWTTIVLHTTFTCSFYFASSLSVMLTSGAISLIKHTGTSNAALMVAFLVRTPAIPGQHSRSTIASSWTVQFPGIQSIHTQEVPSTWMHAMCLFSWGHLTSRIAAVITKTLVVVLFSLWVACCNALIALSNQTAHPTLEVQSSLWRIPHINHDQRNNTQWMYYQ